jgi:tetratricopeptide (TPR) repeat protein
MQLGRYTEGLSEANKALELSPDQPAYLHHKACIHQEMGEDKRSYELASECVRLHPEFLKGWFLLSALAFENGKKEQSKNYLLKLLEKDPGNVSALSILAKNDENDESRASWLSALKKQVNGSIHQDDMATAGFAIARLVALGNDHRLAFEWYQKANRIRSQQQPFSLIEWEASIEKSMADSLLSTFNTPDLARRDSVQSVPDPIFIVGMPRSGTSLCEQIVCSHPSVFGGGELAIMEYIDKTLQFEKLDSNHSSLGDDLKNRMRQVFMDSLPPGSRSFSRVSDKTPRNFERIGLIMSLFPQAQILWCVRHPLDCILSCYFQDFSSGQSFSYRLEHAARVYLGQVKIMRHWMRLFPLSIKTVEYAQLVSQLEDTTRDMASFLELAFHESMLEPHLNPRIVRTASKAQVKQAVYTDSIDNWQAYRQHLVDIGRLLQDEGLLNSNWESTVIAS